jgi:hypothetical protein
VCHADDVATVKELEQHTKPCPNCYIRIFKIDGCDQMFCIQCHTAFSWKTGTIETGIIHNPHYFAALRNGNIIEPRHHEHQGACGPLPSYRDLRLLLTMVMPLERVEIDHFYQQMTHHRHVSLIRYNHVDELDIRHDRINYLSGKLAEPVYRSKLYVRKQKHDRKREEREILNLYVTIGEELFRTFVTQRGSSPIIQPFHTLRDITRDALQKIDKKYQHKGYISVNEIL